MLNSVCVMGRIGQDLQIRTTESGKSLLGFSIACDSDVKREDGGKDVTWIDCTAWTGTAEFIANYFRKGSMIAITGKLQTRQWTDKETGKTRSKMNVLVHRAYFCGEKTDASAIPNAGSAVHFDPNAIASDSGYEMLEDSNEPLPF